MCPDADLREPAERNARRAFFPAIQRGLPFCPNLGGRSPSKLLYPSINWNSGAVG
jgi:hypothetical protein